MTFARLAVPAFLPALVCAVSAASASEADRIPPTVFRGGFAHPIGDRAFWDGLSVDGAAVVRRAEGYLKKPFPETSDALFLDYSKTGNRTRWQKLNNDRRDRLFCYAFAEAVENKGRFLPAYEAVLRSILAEKLWVLPAHDRSLAYFKKGEIHLDLGSTELAWEIAESIRILETKLPADLRDEAFAKVRERVLDPYVEMLSGKRKPDWWVSGTNNWNAVCHCGVVGAALASPIPDDLRATILKGAVRYVRTYIDSFPADGVSDEGIGYWGYGFGRYTAIAELVRRATGGKCDLTAAPAFRTIALAPERQEIDAGVWPSFGDCAVTARPDRNLSDWLSVRLKGAVTRKPYGSLQAGAPASSAFPGGVMGLMYAELSGGLGAACVESVLSPRDWFPDSGILIVRPAAGAKSPRLAAAFKGGHNAESHNHNDNGNFILLLDGARIVADPGNETYTARTFSAKRYDSKVLSGYGHSVPVVDGTYQAPGKNSRAVVLDHTSSDAVETLRYDLRSGYPVKGLASLVRDFVYRRGDSPSLAVSDTFSASRPVAFGSALISFGKFEDLGNNRWRITEEGRRAVATFSAKSGAALKFEVAEIVESIPYPRNPFRLGVSLAAPSAGDTLLVTITPDS